MKKELSSLRLYQYAMVWFLIVSSPSTAMDLALELAEQLYETGNYYEAITEYKRFICFNSEDERVSHAYFQIGMAHRNQAQWEEAVDAFRKSLRTVANDELRDKIRVNIGIVLIASQNYSAAEFELLRVSTFGKYASARRRATFLLGICYLYTFRWEKAREAFRDYFDRTQVSEWADLDSLLATMNYPEPKSPGLAKWLSTFLPGSGQIYAGDVRNGLNALAINLGMGYLLLHSVLEHRYQESLITYLPLFVRYYGGNRYRAGRIARGSNERINREYSSEVLVLLSQLMRSTDHDPSDKKE